MNRNPGLVLAVLLALLAASCATSRRPGAPDAPGVLRLPAEEVAVSKLDVELADKGDEELFAIGMAAFEAEDWPRAAAAFARIADRFPGSRHEATALFDAGLAYVRLGEWRLALERFRALANGFEGPDALEASFRVAECHYRLEDLAAARVVLEGVAARPGLSAADRVRVLTQLGVVELEDGRSDEAAGTLRRALSTWTSLTAEQRQALDPYYPAKAEHFLGEAERGRFLAVAVDPASLDDAQLQERLEQKATLLLAAQGHYLKSIHMGDAHWAVASGVRVGELYDAFREQLLDAPLPPGLDAEESQAYRDELRRRVRVLADKAVDAYQAAVSFAARQGVDDLRFLGDAQAALERLRAALKEPQAM